MFVKREWHGVAVIVASLFFFQTTTFAQKKILTLDQAIDIALEKSYEMKRLRLLTIQAEENLSAAKGRFKTNASMSMDVPYWRESVVEIPVENGLPVYNTTGDFQYQGTLDINQPLPTDGVFTLSSRLYHRDVSTFKSLGDEVKRKEVYSSLGLNFSQPFFTINRLKLGLKQANLEYDRTLRIFKRSELENVYQVTQAFFQLYAATGQMEIASENVEQQQELYDLAKKKFDAGLIAEVGALQFEVDLAQSRNDLAVAEGELKRTEDYFKQLIGLDLTDDIGVEADLQFARVFVDLDRAIELALKNRSEIKEGQIDVELARLSVKETDARSEVYGELLASYDLTGISDPTLPYSSSPRSLFNSSLDDMERRPNNRSVIFRLSVPLWDWGVNAAEVARAEAGLHSAELDLVEQKKTITREVRAAVDRLQQAENRYEVLKKNQDVAQKLFDISVQRFNNGDILSQDLADDRNRLTQAKFSLLQAYTDYKTALADLQRKTMWDFEKDKSLVDEN